MGNSGSDQKPTPTPAPQPPPAKNPPIQAQPHLQNISQRGATPDLMKVETAAVIGRPELSNSLILGEPKAGGSVADQDKGT